MLGHAIQDRVHAQRVPHLERPHLPPKAPADGAVHVGWVVRDFAETVSAVGKQVKRRLAEEAAGPSSVLVQGVEAPGQPIGAPHVPQVSQLFLLGARVLKGLGVDRLDLAVFFLVEAGLRLLTEPPLVHEALHHIRHRKGRALRLFVHQVPQVGGHVHEHVEPHQIGRAEGGRLGPAREFARQGVDLLDRAIAVGEVADGL